MARIAVLGAGMMGSALCVPLTDGGHEVRLVGTCLDDHIVSSLKRGHAHPTLGVVLPAGVRAFESSELQRAAADADVLVVGVSSAGVCWAGEQLSPLVRPHVPVVMVTKGLALRRASQAMSANQQRRPSTVDDSPESLPLTQQGQRLRSQATRPTSAEVNRRDPEGRETPVDQQQGAASSQAARVEGELVTLPDVLESYFPRQLRDQLHPAAIAGPCIAGELARRVPTCVVLTGRDWATCQRLATILGTPYYQLWTSPDLVGVQMCAALKNAYAMGIAFGAGLHEGAGGQPGPVAQHNLEAAILAQSVWEMQRLVRAAGGDPLTVAGLAGVGDLEVTCNGGRTGRFGKLLGAGLGLAGALERMQGATLECREILAVMRIALPLLAAAGQISPASLPLLDHLAGVALDGDPVAVPFERFFRP